MGYNTLVQINENDRGGAFNTNLHNNERTDQVRGQAKIANFEQTALLNKAIGVIAQLINTLQASTFNIHSNYHDNMRHLVNNNESTTSNTQPTGSTTRVGYKDLNNMKPKMLESDVSDISEWDGESDTEIEQAAKMLDDMCSQQSATDPTSDIENPTQTVAKVTIPRVRAPSPILANKVGMEVTSSSTTKSTPTTREKWLSDETLHKLATAVVQGRCTLCDF